VTPISSQERTALLLAAQGHSLDAAARHLGTGKRSYQRILASAQAKLGARNTTNAVAIAATMRIIAVVSPEGAR
jgi:DNA-binding CsgD family transcriptional regulator